MARRFFDIASAVNAIALHDDAGAFEYLFNIYYEKLYRVAYYYMAIDARAEDVISEVFYKIWTNRKKLQRVDNIGNYLFSMVKNQCLSSLRNNRRITYDDSQLDFCQQITSSNPESQLISEEFTRHLDKYINELPPRCRIIFTMVKEDGMKYKEVAELLNISVKTVENQMTKAIAHIRKLVNSYKAGEDIQNVKD